MKVRTMETMRDAIKDSLDSMKVSVDQLFDPLVNIETDLGELSIENGVVEKTTVVEERTEAGMKIIKTTITTRIKKEQP